MFSGCRVTGLLGSLSSRMPLKMQQCRVRNKWDRRPVRILDVSVVSVADDQEE